MTPQTTKLAVGIDLGTTHSALATAELDADALPAVLAVPQLVHAGVVEPRRLLPSFVYLPHAQELPAGALALPWNADAREVVGELARSHGALNPVRLISSAKSWLCHPTLDRRAATLPFQSPPEVPKLSPVAASARILEHLRAAFDDAVPGASLAELPVTLTVPASFDEVARELTVEAAHAAGLRHITLLEEPQAAMYAWVQSLGERFRDHVTPGDLVLVVDVGGGTTDFSLIAVTEHQGELGLERVAVGDHVLLGGDNMDLALAHTLAQRLAAPEHGGKTLDRWQLHALTHAARQAKELLFLDPLKATQSLSIPGRGTGLVGGAIRTELGREDLVRVLVDGFFPLVEPTARPEAPRRLGLSTLGLPYAQDPAVTRHLAAFLSRHASTVGHGRALAHPTAILFNGGVMKATPLVERLVDTLTAWMLDDGGEAPRVLPGANLDVSVAIGAATYGRIKQTRRGLRIRGGTARAYYVGVETAMPAVPGLPPPVQHICLAPMGMEDGATAELPGEDLGLMVGEPAHFRFFSSSTRRDDAPGTVLGFGEERDLEELPPIETTLAPSDGKAAGQLVPVRLRVAVTEVGTLALECVERDGPVHRLEFDLRGPDAA